MECYGSRDEYYSALEKRALLPLGFRAACVPLSFFPEERAAEHPYDMNLSLISLDSPAQAAAGVFTRNSFPGAPVLIARERIGRPSIRGILINNRIANVCAPDGVRDAEAVLAELEKISGGGLFLPASTGIIGWRLPVQEMKDALPALVGGLSDTTILPVAEGIMTTDSYPKIRSAWVGDGRIVGIAKGAGMIEPNMATMLVFILTDISIPGPDLDRACRDIAGRTFNTITVDSDQSTSDMMMILSSGEPGRYRRRISTMPCTTYAGTWRRILSGTERGQAMSCGYPLPALRTGRRRPVPPSRLRTHPWSRRRCTETTRTSEGSSWR